MATLIRNTCLIVAGLAAGLLPAMAFAGLDQKTTFEIPAQQLPSALLKFAAQSGVQVTSPGKLAEGKTAPAVVGTFDAREALSMLLKDSELKFYAVDENTVLIVAREDRAASEQPAASQGGGASIAGAFRLAQEASPPADAGPQERATRSTKEHAADDQEVLVTGSRLRQRIGDGPYEVKVYTQEQIDKSGRSTVVDFLNALPEVSLVSNESTYSYIGAIATVRLRGFPVGTTLTLLNGRRLNNSGFAYFRGEGFDLNHLPLGAIERMEITPVGGSAVYGSDAMAGVVNIILKKDLEGLEVMLTHGQTSGMDEDVVSATWGKRFGRASLTALLSHYERTGLKASERAITADGNYQRFGGPDNRNGSCDPGTVVSTGAQNLPGLGATTAAVPLNGPAAPTIADFAATAGQSRLCTSNYYSLFPPSRRNSATFLGNVDLSGSTQLFGELFLSSSDQDTDYFPPSNGATFAVPASNAFNPFGVAVNVRRLLWLGDPKIAYKGTLVRPVLGLQGRVFSKWEWEVTGAHSVDKGDEIRSNMSVNTPALTAALASSNPATAVNLFSTGAVAPESVLQTLRLASRSSYRNEASSLAGFLRGPAFSLPSGVVQTVIGAEFGTGDIEVGTAAYSRDASAVYGEAKIPLLGKGSRERGPDRLIATLAARLDRYSDVGSKSTPQLGLEWRPVPALLFRGSYGKTFRAPQLSNINQPESFANGPVFDPRRSETYNIRIDTKGNPDLGPETGVSKTLGVVYANPALNDLNISLTGWSAALDQFVQLLRFRVIVTVEDLFPQLVIRDPAQGGVPGRITSITQAFYNYGELKLEGVDFSAGMSFPTGWGRWRPSLAVAYVNRYTAQLTPLSPSDERAGIASTDMLWAPEWKGTAGLSWDLGNFSVQGTGRYTGRYRDYGSTTRYLGDFWLLDLSARYELGSKLSRYLGASSAPYIKLSGLNLLDREPEFSGYGNGVTGYDVLNADVRGRFVSLTLGMSF